MNPNISAGMGPTTGGLKRKREDEVTKPAAGMSNLAKPTAASQNKLGAAKPLATKPSGSTVRASAAVTKPAAPIARTVSKPSIAPPAAKRYGIPFLISALLHFY